MSSHDAQAPKKPRDPDSKQVFLCHSGAQKDFVTQLDKDLRSKDRYPFFDKDKESLPLGHDFPALIIKAIEHCQVGVVVLSMGFFTLKHWPMIELVKMVECKTPHIIPIFLGISPEDLKKEENLVDWKSKWEEWEKSDKRINVSKWESSLGHLRRYNGTPYHSAVGEVKLREEIVEGICKIVPAFHVYDDSHVHGRSRLREVIQVKISEIPAVKGKQVVGLYGMGGIGKTTACKCLIKDLYKEFNGRVCRVEFGGKTSEIDRVREVLKKLTLSTNDEFLHGRDLEWCWSQLKTLLKSNKVVLAIDNYVSGNSTTLEEALKYLHRLEYGQGSIVMVTARALGELTNLGIESGSCLAMPELVRDEARALFLYHALPKDEVDEGVVNQFIDRCHFGKGDGKGSKHYHPLALQVLGSQLVGTHPRDWKAQLKEEDVFNQRQEQDHPVFSILRSSFDTLKFDHKMLFMDVALFDRGPFYKNWRNQHFNYDDYFSTTWYNVFEWLRMVHGISTEKLKKRLNELRKRSLLEELGDGSSHIEMHDLWREFAVMEAKRGIEEESSRWVYEFQVGDKSMAKSCMQHGGWENLRRILIKDSRVKCVNFKDCSKATVLRLEQVSVANEVLDLSPLGRLESLEISFPPSIAAEKNEVLYLSPSGRLKSLDFFALGIAAKKPSGDTAHDLKVIGTDKLTNLVVLVLLDVPNESLSAVAEIANLTNLQILHLTNPHESATKSIAALDLQLLRYLQVVSVRVNCIVSISGFSAKMTDLRFLDLGGCGELKSCVGLGDVDGLEELFLTGCRELEELPNLQKLRRLWKLHIQGCYSLKTVPGLGSLVSLRVLLANESSLNDLPDMSELTNLEELDLSACNRLKCIGSLQKLRRLWKLDIRVCSSLKTVPGLGSLVSLRVLLAKGSSLNDLPDMSELTNLEELDLSLCDRLKCIGSLGDAVALRELRVNCVSLHDVPNLGKLAKSHEVVVIMDGRKMHSFKPRVISQTNALDLAMLGSVSTLKIEWADRELINLSKLTALKSLDMHRCRFKMLPHMGRDMILESLRIEFCICLEGWDGVRRVESRPDSLVDCEWTLAHLKVLVWSESREVDLPDLSHFPRLRSLTLNNESIADGSYTHFLVHCLAEHVHLENLDCRGLTIRDLPDLRKFPSLKVLRIERCVNLTSLTASGPVPALERVQLIDCINLALPDVNPNLFPNLDYFSCAGLLGVNRIVVYGAFFGGPFNNTMTDSRKKFKK